MIALVATKRVLSTQKQLMPEKQLVVLHSPGKQRLPFQEGRGTVEDNDRANLEEEQSTGKRSKHGSKQPKRSPGFSLSLGEQTKRRLLRQTTGENRAGRRHP